MWELDYKESWAQKNWCFLTVVLEKTLENPLDCKEIQPVHPKGNQSWVFIGRTDAEAETPIFWPPDAKSWLTGKDPDAGKGWRQVEKGTTEDQIVRWHHQFNEHGFGWTPGVGDGQGGLACYGSWDRKESDTTEQLNWTEKISYGNKCRNTCWLRKTENLREMTEVKKWEGECIRSLDETVEKHCPLGAGMRGGGGQRAGCLGSGWWYSHECDKGMSD